MAGLCCWVTPPLPAPAPLLLLPLLLAPSCSRRFSPGSEEEAAKSPVISMPPLLLLLAALLPFLLLLPPTRRCIPWPSAFRASAVLSAMPLVTRRVTLASSISSSSCSTLCTLYR